MARVTIVGPDGRGDGKTRSLERARGLVLIKVVDERVLGNGDVERTIVYLFQLNTGGPMTFITRWD